MYTCCHFKTSHLNDMLEHYRPCQKKARNCYKGHCLTLNSRRWHLARIARTDWLDLLDQLEKEGLQGHDPFLPIASSLRGTTSISHNKWDSSIASSNTIIYVNCMSVTKNTPVSLPLPTTFKICYEIHQMYFLKGDSFLHSF